MSHVQASCIHHRREMKWRVCHLGSWDARTSVGGWRGLATSGPTLSQPGALHKPAPCRWSFCCCDILRKRLRPGLSGLCGVRCELPLLLEIELHE